MPMRPHQLPLFALVLVSWGEAAAAAAKTPAFAAPTIHHANAGRRRQQVRPRQAFAPIIETAGRRRYQQSSLQSSSAPDSGVQSDSDSPSVADADAADSSSVLGATRILADFDAAQQSYVASDGSKGMGGGTSALSYLQTQLGPDDRARMREAVKTLVAEANSERSTDGTKGRVMLGFCASNAPEALSGLKSWVTTLTLPRGMLHGMDVDGVPIPPEDLGAVYVKFSTGGAMTFAEMRKTGKGFDALWRPGDALLEPYDGDFRGVYLNLELADGEFRQFGVLPTDLFMEEEEW